MANEDVYGKMNERIDILMKDHKVDFDDSGMDLTSIDTFHKKANALLEAHNQPIPEVDNSLLSLSAKLNLLIEAHGETFDDTDLDPKSPNTILGKLNVLLKAHGR